MAKKEDKKELIKEKGYVNESFEEEKHNNKSSTNSQQKNKKEKTRKKKKTTKRSDSKRGFYDDGYIMQAIIHRSDRIKCEISTTMCDISVVVRLSFFDINKNNLLEKSDEGRAVISRYEKDVTHILPVMTVPCTLQCASSIMPVWEESLLINESFNYITHPDMRVVVFFEVLEVVSSDCLSWAFLQLLSSDGTGNWGRKVRLQMYKPPKVSIASQDDVRPAAFDWWTKTPLTKRIRQPCSLYVTLNKVKVVEEVKPSLRSMYPVQEEAPLRKTNSRLNLISQSGSSINLIDQSNASLSGDQHLLAEIRIPGQSNRLPDQCCKVLSSGLMGCHLVMFSNEGSFLATACQEVSSYIIILYEVPSFNPLIRLTGHLGYIYDFCWSHDDLTLVSASADTSVRFWNVNSNSEVDQAFHPSFVYAAQLQPITNRLLVTGCYDGFIRVWSIVKRTNQDEYQKNMCQLVQQIGSAGHVNSICFIDEKTFFTASSNGVVAMLGLSNNDDEEPATFKKNFEIPEIQTPIDCLLPLKPNKILIQARSLPLLCFDLRIEAVCMKFHGLNSLRLRLRGAVSEDGGMVAFGGEDGVACVWDTNTGQLLHKYDNLGYPDAVTSLHFHPTRDVIVFSCHYYNQPVKLFHRLSGTQLKSLTESLPADSSALQVLRKVASSIELISKEQESRRSEVAKELMVVQSNENPSDVKMPAVPTSNSDKPPLLSITNEDPSKLKVIYRPCNIHRSKLELVVVVEAYEPKRSDEMTLKLNDVISVMHKDTESWWLGQSVSSYQQGFFPANHVVPLKNHPGRKGTEGGGMGESDTSLRRRRKSSEEGLVEGRKSSDSGLERSGSIGRMKEYKTNDNVGGVMTQMGNDGNMLDSKGHRPERSESFHAYKPPIYPRSFSQPSTPTKPSIHQNLKKYLKTVEDGEKKEVKRKVRFSEDEVKSTKTTSFIQAHQIDKIILQKDKYKDKRRSLFEEASSNAAERKLPDIDSYQISKDFNKSVEKIELEALKNVEKISSKPPLPTNKKDQLRLANHKTYLVTT